MTSLPTTIAAAAAAGSGGITENESIDLGDELLEAMDALVEKFGVDRCHFAVEISHQRRSGSGSGSGGRRSNKRKNDYDGPRNKHLKTVKVEVSDKSGELGLLKTLAQLFSGIAKKNDIRASQNIGYYNVDLSRTPSRIELSALRWIAVAHHHAHRCLQQAPNEDKDTDSKPETIMQGPAKWDTLTLSNLGKWDYEDLLNDIAIVDMFESIVLNGHSSDGYYDGIGESGTGWPELASTLAKIYQRGNVKSLEWTSCGFSLDALDTFRTDFLDKRGCLPQRMSFRHFRFQDDEACSRMIGQGLEESQKQGNVRLEALYLKSCKTKAGKMFDGIINSLGCITTLKSIDLGNSLPGSTVQLIAERVLMNPLCRLESLSFRWEVDKDKGDEERRAQMEIFCSAVEQSNSLTRLVIESFDFYKSDVRRLLQFVFSPRSHLQHFSLRNCFDSGYLDGHSSAYDSWTDLVAQQTDGTESDESAEASSSGLPLPARCLAIHCRYGPQRLSHGEILFWLAQISSHRLAYVCDLEFNVDNQVWVNQYKNRHTEDEFNDLQSLRLWLERNRVGRALLLPEVTKLVPAGLWPVVLEKAATKKQQTPNSQSSSVVRDDKGGLPPPLDGIFYLIQGMAQAGHLVRDADPPSKRGRIE